jgi:P27 family predicted phage terminase small subunit
MSAKVVPLPASSAPGHLGAEARAWWNRIQAEYGIEDQAGKLLLQVALEAFDRMRQCQEAIRAEGIIARGSKRQPRAHPLLAVERDARGQMLAALKQLNLDIEPLRDGPGRPPGTYPRNR